MLLDDRTTNNIRYLRHEHPAGGSEYAELDVQAGDHIRNLWPSIGKWLTMIRNFLPVVAAQLKKEGVTHVVDFASGISVNCLMSMCWG